MDGQNGSARLPTHAERWRAATHDGATVQLNSEETEQLLRDYYSITDPEVRRRVAALVRTLAQQAGPATRSE